VDGVVVAEAGKSYFFNWMVGGEKMFIGASLTLIAPWSNSPAVDPVQKSL
jgi:hypothetical protein